MERLKERIAMATRAVLRLQEAVQLPNPSDLERDAIIQRFEFTFEAVWKAAQAYLHTVEGMDVASPKGVIRACREVGLFDETAAVLALKMADDRNLTVHTYNEPLAVAIYGRILEYQLLLANWRATMEQRLL
jgi:nucleotidyltransferase substrate binding protein (TIGR01987 family)